VSVQWDAFSLPELNNFLQFLNREETDQLDLIRGRYTELQQRINERLSCLASTNQQLNPALSNQHAGRLAMANQQSTALYY
jgi:hypothetical protein